MGVAVYLSLPIWNQDCVTMYSCTFHCVSWFNNVNNRYIEMPHYYIVIAIHLLFSKKKGWSKMTYGGNWYGKATDVEKSNNKKYCVMPWGPYYGGRVASGRGSAALVWRWKTAREVETSGEWGKRRRKRGEKKRWRCKYILGDVVRGHCDREKGIKRCFHSNCVMSYHDWRAI